MPNDACGCSQTGTAKMPMPNAERAADRLLQKLKGVTIEREKFIEYRKIVSKVTITEGLIPSKVRSGQVRSGQVYYSAEVSRGP